jgi:hypothetical protein
MNKFTIAVLVTIESALESTFPTIDEIAAAIGNSTMAESVEELGPDYRISSWIPEMDELTLTMPKLDN